MSDRLAELRRQRALIAEHLAWLDRQIAEPGGGGKPALPAASSPAPITPAFVVSTATSPRPPTEAAAVVAAALKASASTVTKPVESPEVAAAADAILDEYRKPQDSLKTDIRKGCILYLLAAFALIGLGVMGLWFAFRR